MAMMNLSVGPSYGVDGNHELECSEGTYLQVVTLKAHTTQTKIQKKLEAENRCAHGDVPHLNYRA